ncbi:MULTISPECIES: GGDEF domain-containing protein [unclassified Cobetia]|uniref:GGDEF domain-containing protein n=2 Tax=Cobetia TaxID=204286 RepID=UPI00209843C6|nr:MULTISPECIES: GGDEF domain-containing protein [unclassified Cobetia]MCO7233989.1 GGDEF domain-containing protein [Cobetia sp. Dlab-2-AX]MCO7237273.1 GGDEF domain-containing protein [Cobetia sp. Dlab-2-U]
MNPMTLCFADDTLERRYRRRQIETSHKLSRITIPLSCLLFASYALIEISMDEHYEPFLLLRAGILVSVLSLFLLSRLPRFRHHVNGILCLASLVAALGTLAMFHLGDGHAGEHLVSGHAGEFPGDSHAGGHLVDDHAGEHPEDSHADEHGDFPVYFVTLLLLVFWTYTLLGLQFIYAMACGLLIWMGCTASCALMHHGSHVLVEANEIFFMMAANLLAGMSAYSRERQSRQLFLHECHITGERDDLRDHAMCDSLTGLLNRRALLTRLDQILDIQTPGTVQAALFIDLDGFKPVNDRHGHAIGDEVLRITGERLGNTLRGNDIVGRLGGDEFLVLISREGNGRKGPEQLAERLIDAISRPITLEVDGEPLIIAVSASIGISLFPFSGATPETVIARADSAMYEAKQRGRGVVVTGNPLRLVL